MTDRYWDFFVDMMMALFMPLVCSYYALSANVFLNVSAANATGLEQLANTLLSPVQYILAGKEALPTPEGGWKFVQRFDYKQAFWVKTASSIFALPPSLVLGPAIKGLSLLDKSTRLRYESLLSAKQSKEVSSNLNVYQQMGMKLGISAGSLTSLGCERRPGDENVLSKEKEALRDITQTFNEAGIPWWVDCGTCLGAYRYGGVIPWDGDIDIAVLLPDFQNVCRALNRLDRKKYSVQDWSTRDHPDSFIKVFIRETGTLIDIYHFAIDPEAKELNYVLSLETNCFMPNWWKIRERRFKVPVHFDAVFPLKTVRFDGIEVFVPNDTKKYLQRYYGENLDPVKIYNSETGLYEKDLSHPYWLRAHAH